jgi:hypothetical protein
MKKFMLPKSPKVYDWKTTEECTKLFTDKWDNEKFGQCEPDAIFYWYVVGAYEGDGALIAIKNGKWCEKCLAHCSCYGPLDGFATDISEYKWNSLKDLLSAGTDDWAKSYKPLVDLAKRKGYR